MHWRGALGALSLLFQKGFRANRSGERTVPRKIHALPWRYRETDVEDLLARSDVWSVEPTPRGLVVNFGWARDRVDCCDARPSNEGRRTH